MDKHFFRVPLYGARVAVIIGTDNKKICKFAERWLKTEIEEPEKVASGWVVDNASINRFVVFLDKDIYLYGGKSINTLTHETRHLTDDIMKSAGESVRANSEASCYLHGWLAEKIFNLLHKEKPDETTGSKAKATKRKRKSKGRRSTH